MAERDISTKRQKTAKAVKSSTLERVDIGDSIAEKDIESTLEYCTSNAESNITWHLVNIE